MRHMRNCEKEEFLPTCYEAAVAMMINGVAAVPSLLFLLFVATSSLPEFEYGRNVGVKFNFFK